MRRLQRKIWNLKKIPSLLTSTTKEKVTFITIHINDYKLSNLCAALSISRRTYYKYRNKEDPDYYDYLLIKDVFDQSKSTYGYRRVSEGLKIKYGVIFNHKKVARIMKKYNLKPEYMRRIRPNVSAKIFKENVRPDLVKRNFKTKALNQIWCTDITYLTLGNKRAYLSTIIDLYDRHVGHTKYQNLMIFP
ncbi:MAG: IS3 family transposase [Mycoplasma sp.]|nr:IS3 family transposase [Mycoplasma sp.]